MSQKASLRWSDSSYQPGQSATLVYDVVDCASDLEAIAACGIGAGTTHPIDGYLVAQAPTVTRPGFGLRRVSFAYARSDLSLGGENANPLSWPPTVLWRPVLSQEQSPRDARGNPIKNTAGQLYSNPPSRTFLDLSLVVTRNEPAFDLDRSIAFGNKVNEDDFVLLGKWRVKAGQCYCEAIVPQQPQSVRTRFVTVDYLFQFREDGWRLRVLSAGRVGWYRRPTDGKVVPGPIWHAGEPVSDDVPLNVRGAPIGESGQYTIAGQPPVASPLGLPRGATAEEAPDGSVFLLYPQFGTAKFAGLL